MSDPLLLSILCRFVDLWWVLVDARWMLADLRWMVDRYLLDVR